MTDAERDPDRDPDPDRDVDPHPDGDPDAEAEPLQPIRRTHNRKASAMLAAGMLALDELLGRKPKEEAPIVVDANGQPVDIDTDGIEVLVENEAGEEVTVSAPPLPRSRPILGARAAGRRGRSARGA